MVFGGGETRGETWRDVERMPGSSGRARRWRKTSRRMDPPGRKDRRSRADDGRTGGDGTRHDGVESPSAEHGIGLPGLPGRGVRWLQVGVSEEAGRVVERSVHLGMALVLYCMVWRAR